MSEPEEQQDPSTPEPEPVVPATIDVSPSSTGVVAGDGSEARPAEPSPDTPPEPEA